MKHKKYVQKNIYKIYLTTDEIEMILNTFDFYISIFKNLKNNYCISNEEYNQIYFRYNKFAQSLFNIYIDKL